MATGLTSKTDVHQGRWTPLRVKKCGVGKGLALYTYVFLDALPTQWSRIKKKNRLDAKITKCLFLGYCEKTKAYRSMCFIKK